MLRNDTMKYDPLHLFPRELAEIFPEAKAMLRQSIRDYEQEKAESLEVLREFRESVREKQRDAFFTWFWGTAYLRHFYLPHILWLDKQISRLHWQLSFYTSPPTSPHATERTGHGEDWELLVRTAKRVQIADVALPYLEKIRHIGRRIIALCPFHTERSASFCIFTDTNTYHCFGCQAGGDVIAFVMQREGLPFREAVRKLQ